MHRKLYLIAIWLMLFSLACTLSRTSPDQAASSGSIQTPTIPLSPAPNATPPASPTIQPTPILQPGSSLTPISATASNITCSNRSEFVADVTIPDGTPIKHGESFVKTWRIRNIGTCTWGAGYRFVQIAGTIDVVDSEPFAFDNVRTGESVDISLTLILDPEQTYAYGEITRARFQMQSPDGLRFGIRPYVDVRVLSPD